MSPRSLLGMATAVLLTPLSLIHAEPTLLRDVEYAKVEGDPLQLDLYLPEGRALGLVVYVHGGGWSSGSKSDCPLRPLRNLGYAVASVDYRLSGRAPFPANVHDIKAAIRFLRAEAQHLGLPDGPFAIAGSSAGGHLAALVGVSNGNPELEGTVGTHPEASSNVDAVISFFGASNLNTILDQSTEFGRGFRVPALRLLLGGLPEEMPDLAKLASPVTHLDRNDPPVLLLHGDADPQMPPQQSEELARACTEAGIPVELHVLPGSRHGGKEFYDAEHMEIVRDFLERSFKQ